LDCFWDHPEKKEVFSPSENLTFHPIDAEKYLTKMSTCAGLISTAGFESVAEAMYLKKPVMMVPVPNHIEQMINAHDGEISGAGIAAKNFDLEIFKDYLSRKRLVNNEYEAWTQKTSYKISEQLESLIKTKTQKNKLEFSDFFIKVISKLLQIGPLKSA
jgi:UDP-N-acetylglucosamine:LPS N-acetylglucosamine transferase